MVHPTDLLRSNSEGGQSFSAPVGNYFNEIDCGITALPCLTRRLRLDKLAKLSVFVVVLSLLSLVHGVICSYFRGTSRLWFSHYNFPSFLEDWFVFLSEISVGILALCVSYWGDRLHRATSIGALTMLTAVAGATLAIPEVYNPFTNLEITSAIKGPALCNAENAALYTRDILGTEGFNEVTFGYFFIFQIMFSMITISFITHGLTYVDDHISAKHSPALIGLALAAHEAGKQFGIYFSWTPYVLKIFSIFSSPAWLVLITIFFMTGIAMAMFPKVLPNMVIKKSVNSLVSIATGRVPFDSEEISHGYFKMMWSFLHNKVLLLNIMSFVLMQAALTNFGLFEKYFNQSKYHVPIEEKDSTGYSDPEIIQFTTNLLRHPLIAVSLITCGTIISKLRPKPKYLVIWNIVAFIMVVLIFSSTVFWNCTKGIENEYRHVITIPHCSSDCSCPTGESFQPVCVDGKTYFSPCLAGCRNYSSATMMYHNCSCGTTVTAGSCDQENCKFILALSQVNNILINALMTSTVLVNFVITMRSVPPKYKATALGLELTFLTLIPYIPVKIVYHMIAGHFCEIGTLKGCQFFSTYFPLALSFTTISFMAAAIIVTSLLLCFIRDLKLYSGEYSNYSTPEVYNLNNETPNIPPSATPEETRVIEEDTPFIRQLSDRIKSRLRRPISKEERRKTYIEEGQLVPPLEPKRKTPRTSGESAQSNTAIVHTEQGGQPIFHEIRPNSRNSNLRNSKASGESDLSSLYRFADSIPDTPLAQSPVGLSPIAQSPIADPVPLQDTPATVALPILDPVSKDLARTDSEPSIKVSQGIIVFQNTQPKPGYKNKRHKNEILLNAPPMQPQRPAPVPNFLVETNL